MALSLDKIDLIEGGYPVDVRKYPHVPSAKGKEPVVDDAEEEAELEADAVEELRDEPVMAEAEVIARPPLPGGTDHTADSEDECDDDEAPPLIRRRINRAVDVAGPSHDGLVAVSDHSDDDDDRPSSNIEGVSSPPRKKAKKQMALASPAQSRSPPGGSSASVEELVHRLQLQEQEHAAAQAAVLRRAEDAIKRQEEAIAHQAQLAEERQRLLLAKQAEHYQAELKRQEALMMARMESMFAQYNSGAQTPVGGTTPLAEGHLLQISGPEPPRTSSPVLQNTAMETGSPHLLTGISDTPMVDMAHIGPDIDASPTTPPPLPSASAPLPPAPPVDEIAAADLEMKEVVHRQVEGEILAQSPPARETPEYSSGGLLND